MKDGTQLKKVRELYSKLVEVQFGFMGKGEFRLKEIYAAVKRKYSCLCDDNFICCECCESSRDRTPEWQHRVRTVLALKRNVKKGDRRSYWIIGK
jgi:hypothetical protein